jgi:anti-anti-sigma regulatory factor
MAAVGGLPDFPVSADSAILVGVFDGFSWIRCEGKGSFISSPAVKTFGNERIEAGDKLVVVDLAGCTSMDSTFMGMLAGMAARLSAMEGGALQIAEPGERNRRSLEDLGLDFLMQIDPPDAPWRGRIDEVRHALENHAGGGIGQLQRARHVLEAHQTLAGMNEKNARGFASVVNLLKDDLAKKEQQAGPAVGQDRRTDTP